MATSIDNHNCSNFASECNIRPPGLVKARNDAKWEVLRKDIYHIYVEEKNTLERTMELIKTNHGFTASLRKWKDKLKEWTYDKYLGKDAMKVIVAKQQKRKAEGKDTVFVHGAEEIKAERIEDFKRRKLIREENIASPSAATPANVTYHTPLPHDYNEVEMETPKGGNMVSQELGDHALLLGLQPEMNPRALEEHSHYRLRDMPDLLSHNAAPSTTANNPCMDFIDESLVRNKSLVKNQSLIENQNIVEDPTAGMICISQDVTTSVPTYQATDILIAERIVLDIAERLYLGIDPSLPPCLTIFNPSELLPPDMIILCSQLASGYFTSGCAPLLYDHDPENSMVDRSTIVNFLLIHCLNRVDSQEYSLMETEAKLMFRQAITYFNSKSEAIHRVKALLCQYYLETAFERHGQSQTPRYTLEKFTLAITLGGADDYRPAYEIQSLLTESTAAVRQICLDILPLLTPIIVEIEANGSNVEKKVCRLYAAIMVTLDYLRLDRFENILIHSSLRNVDKVLDIISKTDRGLEDCLSLQRRARFGASRENLERLYTLLWMSTYDFRIFKKELAKLTRQIKAAMALLQEVIDEGKAGVVKPVLKSKVHNALVQIMAELKRTSNKTVAVNMAAPKGLTVTHLESRSTRSARQSEHSGFADDFDDQSEASGCIFGITHLNCE
ncbi:hypothetical protein SBOR_9392 [Sclerotinia borealis F-4128]|uniref:Clr5 domain-containing protein n=1 Tax=Sclerotinia borealis (strain F-4128) TaxID=1432307 RepID=W9C056_SCLBF|nr:hypothetical protein SBOR_9392 [Sclerotinia borealis F-4128]